MQIAAEIFKAYDIRGIVDKTLTVEVARAIGHALGSEAVARGQKTIAVGRDGRLSGPALAGALAEGICAAGVDVIDVGCVPTPLAYFAAYHLNTDSCVSVTGSHNPPDYNGFKMMLGKASFFGERIQALGALAAAGDFESGAGRIETADVEAAYVERLLRDYRGGRAIDVVWDAGNGAAGPIMEALAARLPGRHGCLFAEVDGRFPNHHPDPTVAENLVDLIGKVRAAA